MKTTLITKICPIKFYSLMVNFMNLIFFKEYGDLYSLLKDLVTRMQTMQMLLKNLS